MRVINIMWSFGSAYASVHKVHRQVLELLPPDSTVEYWVLQGESDEPSEYPCHQWQWPKWRVKPSGIKRLLLPWTRAKLQQRIRESGADLLLLDGLGAARLVLPILTKNPKLQIRVVFHGITRWRAADVHLMHRFAKQVKLIAVSQDLADGLENILSLPVTAIISAFDPSQRAGQLLERNKARQQLGITGFDMPVFGVTARLVESKGIDTVVQAFGLLKQRGAKFKLVIAGEGQLREQLTALIIKLGIAKDTVLLGHVDRVDRLSRAFDLVLIPSRKEGQGLVLQEAVQAGVPVLVSDLAVFREQLGPAGPYLPVGDAQAWADSIEALMNEGKYEQLAVEQRDHLVPNGAWDEFCQAWKKQLNVE